MKLIHKKLFSIVISLLTTQAAFAQMQAQEQSIVSKPSYAPPIVQPDNIIAQNPYEMTKKYGKNNMITAPSASGRQETTVVDTNGNLKMIPPKNEATPSTSTPVTPKPITPPIKSVPKTPPQVPQSSAPAPLYVVPSKSPAPMPNFVTPQPSAMPDITPKSPKQAPDINIPPTPKPMPDINIPQGITPHY